MLSNLLPAFRMMAFMTVLTGLLYPLVTTGLWQVLFRRQANGSLVLRNGQAAGSALIGQNFTAPGYFHPRPSSAGAGYDGLASGGSNLAPTSRKLYDRVQASIQTFRKENPGYTGAIPADLVTSSASGLDPHLSPASALAQTSRVAAARGLPEDTVHRLVEANIESRELGLLGEPRVNVLALNLALDRSAPK